jgi:hypothetical protein
MSTNLELVLTTSGLDNDGQLSIKEALHPFWVQALDWQTKVAEVTDPKVARASRLTLKKIRVEAGHKKDELKENILVRGRAIDAAFRAIESTIIPLEDQLDSIEKAEARRIEAETKARATARTAELAALEYTAIGVDLGKLSDHDYDALLCQAHSQLAQRQEVARVKAEAEARLAEERRQREQAEAKLRAEVEVRLAEERKARIEAEAKARAEAEARLALERKARAEAEAKAKAEADARLAVERKAREEAEAKARAEAEAKAKAEEALRIEAARRAEEAARAVRAKAEEEVQQARLAAQPDVEKLLRVLNESRLVAELCNLKMTTDRGIKLRDSIFMALNTAIINCTRSLENAR